ncbi:MAG TPA: cdisaccharide synthetase [Synergistaceae bacterium]|nr:cdisaccharide synthetase [Synergistaceae bacterium]HPQ37054.1 cdisaccharide synthetase [Synergistaceae bacterium]
MRRYLVLANGPGEVWGWARPLLKEILRRKDLPELCLLPCQFASGRELEAVERHLPVQVYPLSGKTLFRQPRKGFYSGIIQLGGDLLFGRYFAWRYGCPLATYTYGWKKGLRSCCLVGTAFETMRKNLEKRGESSLVTGDLVASALEADPHVFSWKAPEGRRVAFFPGSRKAIRQAALAYAGEIRGALVKRVPEVEMVALLSPFSDPEEPPLWEKEGFRTVTTDTGGVLEKADLALTQPGTNTLELLHTRTPGIVAVPDRFLSLVPLPGILGGLDRIPFVRSRIRQFGIRRLRSSLRDYLAWPNRIAGKEILPERIGPCSPEEMASEAAELLLSPERREIMQKDLAWLGEETIERPGDDEEASSFSSLPSSSPLRLSVHSRGGTAEDHRNAAVRFMNILEERME